MLERWPLKETLLVLALGTLITVRLPMNEASSQQHWAGITYTPLWMDRLAWSQVQPLGADFTLLRFFSTYYDATHTNTASGPEAWKAVQRTIFRAQALDPQFVDIYHIGIPLLAYDAKMPQEALRLAHLGNEALPSNWQIPFVGAFIAYDQLKDYKEASRLMSKAALAPKAPSLAISLSVRFLKRDFGSAESIELLRKLRAAIPKGYHQGIESRIQELLDATETHKK